MGDVAASDHGAASQQSTSEPRTETTSTSDGDGRDHHGDDNNNNTNVKLSRSRTQTSEHLPSPDSDMDMDTSFSMLDVAPPTPAPTPILDLPAPTTTSIQKPTPDSMEVDSEYDPSTTTQPQQSSSAPQMHPSINPLLRCGRRMLLTALIIAHKYLQDRSYSNNAWSRLCGLTLVEINTSEIEFLKALDWKVHIVVNKKGDDADTAPSGVALTTPVGDQIGSLVGGAGCVSKVPMVGIPVDTVSRAKMVRENMMSVMRRGCAGVGQGVVGDAGDVGGELKRRIIIEDNSANANARRDWKRICL
ncbi:hypothetical protein HK102_006401 [Quaeritorhiza haematococci]|nr:hypothetical protein HK102_006401 [Quaeritorhiza haematococci]